MRWVLAQIFPRDRTGRDAHHGLARRGAAAAAIVERKTVLFAGRCNPHDRGESGILDFFIVSRERWFFILHRLARRLA